jgi:hypothetical protein
MFSCLLPKFPCGPRETAISRDRLLVVVTVVVWCPLRILDVMRRAWNRRVSFRHDRGDTGTLKAPPILSYVTGCVFMPVTKVPCGPRETAISRDRWLVVVTVIVLCPLRICLITARYLSCLICNTWSVTGALPVTKGNICPLPKWVFHVVSLPKHWMGNTWRNTIQAYGRRVMPLSMIGVGSIYSPNVKR